MLNRLLRGRRLLSASGNNQNHRTGIEAQNPCGNLRETFVGHHFYSFPSTLSLTSCFIHSVLIMPLTAPSFCPNPRRSRCRNSESPKEEIMRISAVALCDSL